MFGRLSVCPDGFKKFKMLARALAVVGKSEAPTAEPKAPLVLPAKSQSGFLESIDKNTVEIQCPTTTFYDT